MAKTNKEKIIALCNEINKKEGQGSIYSIGSKGARASARVRHLAKSSS